MADSTAPLSPENNLQASDTFAHEALVSTLPKVLFFGNLLEYIVLQPVYASMSVFKSDERTDNPTVITDSLLIHPEDHAEWMDGMRTIFRLHTLLVVQNLATKQGDRVNGRKVYRELNRIYEDEEIYRQRVYDALDWHCDELLLTRRDTGPGDKTEYSYQLTPHGKGVLKRHAELTLGMINGQDYETIVREGLDLSE